MSQRYASHENIMLHLTIEYFLAAFSKVPSAVGSEQSSCAISVTSQKIPRAILIGIDVQIALQIFMEPMHPTNLVSQI